jgi:predicted glycosyltransferase
MDAPKPIDRLHENGAEPAGQAGPGGRPWRVALYSHDTMGIGHMRRNALIARTIAGSPVRATMLLIGGAREAGCFPLPPGTDCLTLPSYYKQEDGQYESRSLLTSRDQLTALRARTITAALEAFEPDVLIVDKVPRGALRELGPALELLRAEGWTRCVLGLRDILDDPATVGREWVEGSLAEAVRDYYDAVWVYGDPAVYDQAREYGYPADVAAKVRYTGYVARPQRTSFSEIEGAELLPLISGPADRLFLCMVGGGQDGVPLAETFARVEFPAPTRGVILTGPFMPADAQNRLCRLAATNPGLRVVKFVTDPDLLLSLADRVVAMAGYNTVCEALSFGKPALVVPRVAPRREQLIRAERLQQMGLVDMLRPGELTPEAISRWLYRDCRLQPAAGRINLGGATTLPRFLEDLLQSPARAAGNRRRERNVSYATA